MKKITGIAVILIIMLSIFTGCGKTEIYYDINFIMNSENVMYAPDAQKVIKDGKVSKPPVSPTVKDKTFLGWFTSNEGAVPYKFNEKVNQNTDIHAKWLDNSHGYFDNLTYVESNKFRGNNGITDAKAPISAADTALIWEKQLASGWSSAGWPIELGDYIYATSTQGGHKINKLNKYSGEIILSTSLAGNVGFFSSISCGEGKIFVPVSNGRLQAFDADTLLPLWITKVPYNKDGAQLSNMQSLSTVLYYEGYVYMGVSNGDASTGAFFCVNVRDENTELSDEEKDFIWIFSAPDRTQGAQGGFYWSVGAIAGEYIVFAGEEGVLYSHHLTSADKDENGITIFKDTFQLQKINNQQQAVRSGMVYSEELGRIFLSSKSGNIHSIKFNTDGTFDRTEGSYKTQFLFTDITSTLAVYRGRLYVGGGGIQSNAGFSVLNAETLEKIYNKDILTQSSPIISTAYATAENNYKVYIYLLKFDSTPSDYSSNPDGIYIFEDDQERTEAKAELEFVPSPKPNYNTSSAMISKDGIIYYKNDSGYMFAFGSVTDNTYTHKDVINFIEKLPDTESFSLYNKDEMLSAFYRYTALTDAEKANVINFEKLGLLIAKYEDMRK